MFLNQVPAAFFEALYFPLMHTETGWDQLSDYSYHAATADVQNLPLALQRDWFQLPLEGCRPPLFTRLTTVRELVQFVQEQFVREPLPPRRRGRWYLADNMLKQCKRDLSGLCGMIWREWEDLVRLLAETHPHLENLLALWGDLPYTDLQLQPEIVHLPRQYRMQAIFPLLGIFAPGLLESPKHVFWPEHHLPQIYDNRARIAREQTRTQTYRRATNPKLRALIFHALTVADYLLSEKVRACWTEELGSERRELGQHYLQFSRGMGAALQQWAELEPRISLDPLPTLPESFSLAATPSEGIQFLESQILDLENGGLSEGETESMKASYSLTVAQAKTKLFEATRHYFVSQLQRQWREVSGGLEAIGEALHNSILRIDQVFDDLDRQPVLWVRVEGISTPREWLAAERELDHHWRILRPESQLNETRLRFLTAFGEYMTAQLHLRQFLLAVEYRNTLDASDSMLAPKLPSTDSMYWESVQTQLYEEMNTTARRLAIEEQVAAIQGFKEPLWQAFRKCETALTGLFGLYTLTDNAEERLRRRRPQPTVSLALWNSSTALHFHLQSLQYDAFNRLFQPILNANSILWRGIAEQLPQFQEFTHVRQIHEFLRRQKLKVAANVPPVLDVMALLLARRVIVYGNQ